MPSRTRGAILPLKLRTILNFTVHPMNPPPVPAPSPSVLPVAQMATRARGIVVGHTTDAATTERLSALGLGIGAGLTVLRAGLRATVQVGETRIGLGPELSCAVRVCVR